MMIYSVIFTRYDIRFSRSGRKKKKQKKKKLFPGNVIGNVSLHYLYTAEHTHIYIDIGRVVSASTRKIQSNLRASPCKGT